METTSFTTFWTTHFSALRVPDLDLRWVTPEVLAGVLRMLPHSISQQVIGKSAEGRPIHMLRLGHGKKPVLAWAAMHGNETTAMRGWLDLFVNSTNPDVQAYLAPLLDAFSIYFIPMLNPDGAARYTRRNAQGLDMNRDARALQSPEMQLLMQVIEQVVPVIAFNLHDQRNLFAVNYNAATVSFLSPSVDVARSMNPTRARAMDYIGSAYHELATFLAGHIGRYTDAYYPTAIGECVQERGIATILVECGAAKNDPLRQRARMAMPIVLLAILARAKTQTTPEVATYNAIPINEQNQVDILLKGVHVVQHGKIIQGDIALMAEECVQNGAFICQYKIDDFGDLRNVVGLAEYDGRDVVLEEAPRIGQQAHFTVQTPQGRLCFEQGQKK